VTRCGSATTTLQLGRVGQVLQVQRDGAQMAGVSGRRLGRARGRRGE